MMRKHTAGETVKGGFYFNTNDWNMLVVPPEGEVLPGEPGDPYLAFPAVAVLAAAPILSLAFVIFLPFIGIAMLTRVTLDKLGLVATEKKAVEAPAEARK